MKHVDVKDQVRLTLAKVLELVVSGIKYRLFRSAVTVATVGLAVAFLMTMLSQSVVRRTVGIAIDEQTAPRRTYEAWLGRLSKPLTQSELQALLMGRAVAPEERFQELRTWGQLSDQELATLQDTAVREQQYLDYFTSLDEGNRALLLEADMEKGGAILASLADEQRRAVFARNLEKMPVVMGPSLRAGLDEFVRTWNAQAPLRQRVLRGHAEAVNALAVEFNNHRMAEVLAEADDQTRQIIEKYGFRLSAERMGELSQQAQLSVTVEKMLRWRSLQEVRALLAKQASVPIAKVSDKTMLDVASSKSGATMILNVASKGRTVDLTPELMVEAAEARLRQDRQAQIEATLAGEDTEGYLGFSRRTMWLIVVSFGVCAVGIANAMLMSVTERFREIATMKCLGAMDGFIMLQFVLESCIQGVAGGVVGAAVGLLLGVVRSWVEFGLLAFSQLPGWTLLGCIGGSLVSGVLLAALAAVYPAFVASRMAPMEAMRME